MSIERGLFERGPFPGEMEKKTAQESPVDMLELETPAEDPWFQHERVDQYNSQQIWEDLCAKTLKKWEAGVLMSPNIQGRIEDLKESGKDDIKQQIESNIGIVLKNEVLRYLDNTLEDKTLDYQKIEALMLDEVDPLGKEGLASEMRITQKLVEAGIEARFSNETPQNILNEERLIAFIENASPGFFEGKNKEERLRNLKHYASLFLKGYLAISYAYFRENPLAEGPEIGKAIDTMTDLSFDLHKYYQRPLKDWPWPAKNDWRLRNLEIQDKIDSMFGVWTNPAGHSYKLEK